MKKGDKVVVRQAQDYPKIALVWEWDTTHIFVVSPENYDALERGGTALFPVAFRRQWVYKYFKGVEKMIERWKRYKDFYSRLEQV
jgi:hypothetical protein